MVPSFFICHGSPDLILENNDYTNFLEKLGKKVKPKAIIMFTAHWESNILSISYNDGTYDMIYDFGGFPKELYAARYPAKGSIEIAAKLQERLEGHGIEVEKNTDRGLDHGSWVVLKLMYPNADIPVVQVSINPNLPPEKQYEIGQSIRDFGEEDIMVIGSGGTVHNLHSIKWGESICNPEAWALELDDWLINKIQNKDMASIFEYRKLAPYAKLAAPTEDHIAPLFIAMGSRQDENTPKLLQRSYAFGTLSHICIEF